MKILIVGQFSKGSLCDSYLSSLKQLGHETYSFDDVEEYNNISELTRQRYVNRLLEMYFIRIMNEKLLKYSAEVSADLCLIMKGLRILPETIVKIKSDLNPVIFNINADDPFNKNRGSSSSSVRKSLKLFDCYFIWSKVLLDKLKKNGLKQVEYLPFCYDPEIHYRHTVSREESIVFGNDVLFVGNWEKRRGRILGHIKDFDLGIWGGDYWKSRCHDKKLSKKWKGREATAEEMAKTYAASKISLNILREQNLDSINMRTFEAPGCGAFVLAEKSREARSFFAENKEAVYFSNARELREKIRYYLKNEKERSEIAAAGHKRCISSGYTYLERTNFILSLYESYFSRRRKAARYKVAFLVSHPIQYRVPLYQKISNDPRIDFSVYFCSDIGLKERYNSDFRKKFKWDILDLRGINYTILKNYLPYPVQGQELGMTNLGILRVLTKEKYDALFIPGYSVISYLLGFLGASIAHIPIIFGGEPRFPPATSFIVKRKFKDLFLRFLFSHVQAVAYIGKMAKAFYRYYGVPEEKLFFTPYCVDNEFMLAEAKRLLVHKEELKKELGLPEGLPMILYLSKINANKRPFDIVESFSGLNFPASLAFVGDGPLLKRLKISIERKKIKNVFFLGFQNNSQVSKYYAAADIFVLPSQGESWGVVINEAMCFGLPIITTNKVMASYDLVREGENGYILFPGDIAALTSALKELLSDPEKRRRMGERSTQIISEWHYGLFIEGFVKAMNFVNKK